MIDKEYIKINIATGKTFSYLEYHTDSIIKVNNPETYFTPYSFVKKIEVDNQTENDYQDLIIHFEFSNEIFNCEDFHIGYSPKRNKYVPKIDPKIKIDEKKLYELNGIASCNIFISLRDPNNNNKELCSNNKTIKILPICQATSDIYKAPLLFAKYCVTDFTQIINIQHAANIEKAKINGFETDCIIGYQNNDENDVVKELTSIYRAIHNTGNITYSNPPNSNDVIQNIRMPNVVLKTKLGTCLDLSLLFCSALLQVGLHPILILIEGHAFAGCFLHEYDSFNGYFEDKPSVVFSDATSEDKKLVLFECTTATNTSTTPFSETMKIANENLRAYRGFFVAIDIYRAQNSYFKPIPIANEEGNIDFTIPVAKLKEEEINDLNEYQGKPIPDSDSNDRFSTWEKKLLDLSTANKLVNFRFSKDHSNYSLIIPPNGKGKEIFEFLKHKDGSFSIGNFSTYMVNNEDGQKTKIEDQMLIDIATSQIKNDTLLMDASVKTMKSLIKKDSESREETGSPTLYLAIGLLKGNDSTGRTTKEIRAPFLLLPVKITKNRYGDEFTVTYDIEDMMVNKTFFEYYKLKKGSDYDNLYTISSHNQFEDIVATLRENHSGDIQLDENVCFFANFLFTHMVMWQDIIDRKDVLRQNVIVKSLLENQSFINDEPIEVDNVDELDTMKDFAAPLPYDSTQLKAIRECAKGNSFILDGPPGTGKSQTIVNMIVNAFYHGKTVLFVAEKQAALEVVRQRLATLNLDQFALQLYSSKTNKQTFFNQLSKSMGNGKKSSDEDFNSICDAIEEQKKIINNELKRLHSHKKYFYSLYEAITKELATSEIKTTFNIEPSFLDSYNSETNDKIRNIIRHIEKVNNEFDGSECEAYLQTIEFKKYSFQDQNKINDYYKELSILVSNLKSSFESFKGLINDDELSLTKNNINFVIELIDILLNKEVKIDCFSTQNLKSYFNDMISIMSELREFAKLENELRKTYKIDGIESVNGNDVRIALSKGTNIFNRGKAKKESVKLLSPMLKDNADLTNEQIVQISEIADKYNKSKENVIRYKYNLSIFFGESILDSLSDFDKYQELFDNTYNLYKLVLNGDEKTFNRLYTNIKGASPFVLPKIREAYTNLKNNFDNFNLKFNEIISNYPLDLTIFENIDFLDLFKSICDLFTVEENQYKISQYTKLLSDYDELEQLGLSEFVSLIKGNDIQVGELERTYEHSLCHAFVLNSFVNDDENNEFDSNLYEEQINKYQELIKKYNSLCVGETIEKITSKFEDPEMKRSASSPIGALRKLCMSSGKGISIRNTLNKFEDLIRMYFPCFLMSPLAAAQYLDVNSKKFDIVIFDEASQIPTSEAIGPIARGNSLIVAGDPQQMPPSDYFSVTSGDQEESLDGEDALLEDAESLLDDCIAIDMPRIRLAFHYRSKHESLIRFSNHNFYGGDLFTFPSTDNLKSHVSFIHVDATNKKKGSDISTEEIEAILNVLKQLLENKNTKNKSIGIIVFNSAQQEKLEDEVDSFLNKNQEYLTLTHWTEEDSNKKLFVKNLENVQGDERDIIIMSVGFLKGHDGKALINGPLALAKGERRLNVAASRSIEQMIVISTIYANDIDEVGKKNQGAKNLKDFLRFAQNSNGFVLDQTNDSDNKDLAFFISKELKEKGYECDVSIGSSEFKVDLAVRKPNKQEYILGILLDEKPLNGNVSCRDRFYVEPVILKTLKWKILRIYTVSFLRYKSKTIKKIIETIESLEDETEEEQNLYIPPVMTEHHISKEDFGIIEYQSLKLDKVLLPELNYGTYYQEIVNFINDLIKQEYPISKNMLLEKIKENYYISRMTQKTVSIIMAQIKIAGPIVTEDYDSSIFYWPKDCETKVNNFRSSTRDILDISKEELLALMNSVIRIYKDIDKEELIRVVAELMNITVITSKIRRKLEYVINYASVNNLFEVGYHENASYIVETN